MITAEHITRFIPEAVKVGNRSPCQKSQRGVVIIEDRRDGPWVCAAGYNAPPLGFGCDGSEVCRSACSKLCVHAEAAAIQDIWRGERVFGPLHMLHVKVVRHQAVASGPPSCWQCSREIADSTIVEGVWLLHDDGGSLRPHYYPRDAFHEQTLLHCGLPVIR